MKTILFDFSKYPEQLSEQQTRSLQRALFDTFEAAAAEIASDKFTHEPDEEMAMDLLRHLLKVVERKYANLRSRTEITNPVGYLKKAMLMRKLDIITERNKAKEEITIDYYDNDLIFEKNCCSDESTDLEHRLEVEKKEDEFVNQLKKKNPSYYNLLSNSKKFGGEYTYIQLAGGDQAKANTLKVQANRFMKYLEREAQKIKTSQS